MTVVVDSSVWIALLRDEVTVHVGLLRTLADQALVRVPDLVVAEVLQGSRDRASFDHARTLLISVPVLMTCGESVAVRAAENYRTLRALGITVRSTIDTLIATRCIVDGHELLHNDRDFDGFEQHLGLRVVRRPAAY